PPAAGPPAAGPPAADGDQPVGGGQPAGGGPPGPYGAPYGGPGTGGCGRLRNRRASTNATTAISTRAGRVCGAHQANQPSQTTAAPAMITSHGGTLRSRSCS